MLQKSDLEIPPHPQAWGGVQREAGFQGKGDLGVRFDGVMAAVR
jgi:hypothetical protein